MGRLKGQKVLLGVQGDSASFKPIKWIESKGKNKYFQGVAPDIVKPEEMTNPAILVNKLKHNASLSYNGEGMIVAPQARVKIADFNKLGALPRGVVCIPIGKK
jgi:hypothetical protein